MLLLSIDNCILGVPLWQSRTDGWCDKTKALDSEQFVFHDTIVCFIGRGLGALDPRVLLEMECSSVVDDLASNCG